jgi:hypothetical protein
MRTSAEGWRIVAIGTLVAIFGLSALMNQVGPNWFAFALLLIGAVIIFVGRQR